MINYKTTTVLSFFLCLFGLFSYAQEGNLKGSVINKSTSEPIKNVIVKLQQTDFAVKTGLRGDFLMENIPYGDYEITFFYDGKGQNLQPLTIDKPKEYLTVSLDMASEFLDEVFISATASKNRKLSDITRLPIRPQEDMQNIYVKDDKFIKQIGAINVGQVTQNISGVYTFATYGVIRESMSIRGLRGIPILKNGILVSRDIGGRGFATDMEGVESVQVIKGADAVNMGASTSYGNAGGLINLVTKTPHFVNRGEIGMRLGSFNQLRSTFDVETTIGDQEKAAFRIDGAYETTQTYQKISNVNGESFYINPSVAFRPDDQTEIILELDHYQSNRTFDPGTVNMDTDNKENNLYTLPKNQFLGFESDKIIQKMTTASARLKRFLSDDYYIRGAATFSNYDTSGPSTKLVAVDPDPAQNVNVQERTVFARTLERHKEHHDNNYAIQVDFVGDHIKTGALTHTFQAGIDYRAFDVTQRKYSSLVIDTVDITRPVSHHLPLDLGQEDLELKEEIPSKVSSFGFSAQEFLEIANRIKIKGGIRLGTIATHSPTSIRVSRSNFVNPFAGVMVRVWEDVNLYGNYTNTSDPANANMPDKNGNPIGTERFDQYEAGIRSSWFGGRLRGDIGIYRIDNKGMVVQQTEQDENGISQPTGHYFKGGHVRYQGIEMDLTGYLTSNLQVNAGFSKMKGEYLKSDEFWIGSSPKNIPDWTIHAEANYAFTNTSLKGLSIGAGYYYVGKRAYNDWLQLEGDYHGIEPGLEPWILKSYATFNARLAYDFKHLNTPALKNLNAQLIFNNIGDAVGYTAYRDKNINRIDPFNTALVLAYRF